jgi:hypothetical protein
MLTRHSLGSVARIYLDIVAAGAGVISQLPTFAVQRRKDGKWFKASDATWNTAKTENAAVQTDVTNLPGRYHFDFDQTLDPLLESTDYIVKKTNAAGTLAQEYEDLGFGQLAGAAQPGLCSVQGTIFDAQGQPMQNILVSAWLEPVFTDTLGRTVEADRSVATYSNESGDFDLPLVRGAIFRVEITAVGYNRRAQIPDQASVLFTDL